MDKETYWEDPGVPFSELKGKVLVAIEQVGKHEVWFTTSLGEVYYLWHRQDCCESVTLEEVVGDYKDLLFVPIELAEEVVEKYAADNYYSYYETWTFYKLHTVNGDVTLRWVGSSNGYYSESVDFSKKPGTPLAS